MRWPAVWIQSKRRRLHRCLGLFSSQQRASPLRRPWPRFTAGCYSSPIPTHGQYVLLVFGHCTSISFSVHQISFQLTPMTGQALCYFEPILRTGANIGKASLNQLRDAAFLLLTQCGSRKEQGGVMFGIGMCGINPTTTPSRLRGHHSIISIRIRHLRE